MNILKIFKNTQARLFFVAILLGLIATLLVQSYIDKIVYKLSDEPKVEVIVAKTSIDAGESITADAIEVLEIPQKYLTQRMVMAGDKQLILGRSVRYDINRQGVIFWHDISTKTQNRLSDFVGFKERAVTLSTDNNNSFSNMIQPGDRIDIALVSSQFAQAQAEDESEDAGSAFSKQTESLKVVMKSIFVLAVNDNMEQTVMPSLLGMPAASSQDKAVAVSSVTLKVSLTEAAQIVYAESVGRLVFFLRNRGDIFTQDDFVDFSDMLKAPEREPEAVTLSQSGYPQIFEGGKFDRLGYYPGQKMVDKDIRDIEDVQFPQTILGFPQR